MFRTISAILESIRQMRSRKRITRQFLHKGFRERDCPTILELLPLRDAGIIREGSNLLFEKGDTQMLVFSTTWTPRSRTPARPSAFHLLCLSLGDDPAIREISAAIREPAERYSIVDQLELDSYPSLSPLPQFTIFAANLNSAQQMLAISRDHRPALSQEGNAASPGSLIVHKGRLMLQMSA